MRLKDLVDSQADWAAYERLLGSLSSFLNECVDYVTKAFQVAQSRAATDRRLHHGTVFLLVRHVLESIDAVAVLVEKGCATPCDQHLRSAFEGMIGIQYILEIDSERRGLAYQVAHAHRKIKLYRKCNPSDQLGQETRTRLKDDPLASVLDDLPKKLPADFPAAIANLEGMLTKPEYAPIEKEWQASKKRKSDPRWYALFGGPQNIRALAGHVGYPVVYEFLYSQWSDIVHAGGGFDNIGQAAGGAIVYRPLRHPDGLQAAISLAAGICLATARRLIEAYAPDQKDYFAALYVDKLQARYREVASGRNLIHVPWR